MAKHRTHGRGIQIGNGKSVTVEVPLPLLASVSMRVRRSTNFASGPVEKFSWR